MIAGWFIIAGYVLLIAMMGWPGVLAAGLHLGILLVCLRRK